MANSPRALTRALWFAALVGVGLAERPAFGDSWAPLPNPSEPSQAELLRESGAAIGKPDALAKQLDTLLRGSSHLDVWIPYLRQSEHYDLISAATKLGYGERKSREWVTALPGLLADLKVARLKHPARHVDAILRHLEEVGTVAQVEPLMEAATRASTEWGRWKCYASVQGILARCTVEDAKKLLIYPALMKLLRDLPAETRGRMAAALYANRKHTYTGGWPSTTASASLWLAWSLSAIDPDTAVSLFRLGLELPDPAVRLFAGLGIARVTDDTVPYRLTANRRTTAAQRAEWLKRIKPHKSDDWHFADPLALPIIHRQSGDRVDLVWLAPDGTVARRQEDVWPGVARVFPDGTFVSWQTGRVRLTDPDGEVLVRYSAGPWPEEHGAPVGHGGFFAMADNGRRLIEYAACGESLWEMPIENAEAAVRSATWAGPGSVVVVRNRRVEVLNRRGDVIWSVAAELDTRTAYAVDPDTVLIVSTTFAELHHRTKGRLARADGYKSLLGARYHPTKPWLLFDHGVALHDVKGGKVVKVPLDWKNWDPSINSKWVKPVERHPDK